VALQRLRITSLRCLEAEELAFSPDATYVFGPNGAGKTSVLEAIFVLSRGRSFRTRQIRQLVRHGSPGFAVYAELTDPSSKIGVAFGDSRLDKRINGRSAPGMAELAALLPAYSIDPGLHTLLESGPSDRRRFLDWGVFHVEHDYLPLWRRYRRLVGQRNAALKAADQLAPWTVALAVAGTLVDEHRRRYVSSIAPLLERLGEALLGDPLQLEYRAGWPSDVTLAKALELNESKDRETGATSVGPHRADVIVKMAGRRVQSEASRGQQKLAVAAMVLAQVAAHHGRGAATAILLVDDPAAELDPASLQRLLECLTQAKAQLVITGITPFVLPTREARVFHVERGKVRAL
jgi:DNA replication and repair protein RecF